MNTFIKHYDFIENNENNLKEIKKYIDDLINSKIKRIIIIDENNKRVLTINESKIQNLYIIRNINQSIYVKKENLYFKLIHELCKSNFKIKSLL